MNTQVFGLNGSTLGNIDLPIVFDTPYRIDIIRKAYTNLSSNSYQPQGRYPAAGEIVSAESRNTGLGMARISRARGEGFPRAGQAAGVASVRHGRAAHPPVSWRILSKKLNKKEKILAFCSAIAATAKREVIQERGHKIGKHFEFPIVLTNEIENIHRTSDLKKILITLDLEQDLNRAKFTKRIPSGKGRMRGRNRCTALSAIIVVKKGSPICKLKDSLPGINVKSIDELSVLDLAPGANPIRLTIYSKNAIEFLGKLKCRPHLILEVSKENV